MRLTFVPQPYISRVTGRTVFDQALVLSEHGWAAFLVMIEDILDVDGDDCELYMKLSSGKTVDVNVTFEEV